MSDNWLRLIQRILSSSPRRPQRTELDNGLRSLSQMQMK